MVSTVPSRRPSPTPRAPRRSRSPGRRRDDQGTALRLPGAQISSPRSSARRAAVSRGYRVTTPRHDQTGDRRAAVKEWSRGSTTATCGTPPRLIDPRTARSSRTSAPLTTTTATIRRCRPVRRRGHRAAPAGSSFKMFNYVTALKKARPRPPWSSTRARLRRQGRPDTNESSACATVRRTRPPVPRPRHHAAAIRESRTCGGAVPRGILGIEDTSRPRTTWASPHDRSDDHRLSLTLGAKESTWSTWRALRVLANMGMRVTPTLHPEGRDARGISCGAQGLRAEAHSTRDRLDHDGHPQRHHPASKDFIFGS